MPQEQPLRSGTPVATLHIMRDAVAGAHWWVVFAVLAAALTDLVGVFIGPAIIATILNSIQQGQLSREHLTPLICAYAAATFFSEVIGWRATIWATWRLERSAQQRLYDRSFAQLMQLSVNFHADRFSGALVSQVNKLVNAFETIADNIIFSAVPLVVVILGAVIASWIIYWPFGLVMTILTVIFLHIMLVTSRRLLRSSTAEAQASAAVTAQLADAVANVSVVKSFGREALERKHFGVVVDTWRQRSLTTMRSFLLLSSGYALILFIVKIAAVLSVTYAAATGILLGGTAFLVLSYTLALTQQLWVGQQILRRTNQAFGDAHDMVQILQLHPSITDTDEPETVGVPRGGVVFDRVDYTHADADKALFRNFSLTILPGERVGVVGVSGSGKTTLTRLLMRLIDVDAGVIRIDGVAINRMRQTDLRHLLAYVPQEPLLFHRTVAENIGYGAPESGKTAIRAAAQRAHAWDFIKDLPQGLDTVVGERGVKLSGGQRQRIAIARAMLVDSPIVLLDEATSALDSASEVAIQEALAEVMRGRTTIVVAHRLSTVQAMDRIIVLDDGRVIESGTHDELLVARGQYWQLWSHQSGGFIH